ncbi:NUDIX hydrolase [Streptomyces sp. NPDC088725]|uniref:NUDIX hydrolase n=1 Tax=Streptomyces sp. NPDC088725 TaxID=3365873 RepID=UPI003810BD0A
MAGTHRRDDLVLAAGCVLWRRSPHGDGGTEICLVHRPKYDDWSHPKGKLKRGEETLTAALREVLEETGHHCAPGAHLGTIHYQAQARPKQVTYWAAEATGGEFSANDEVDRVLWLSPEGARARLTQARDRALIDTLLENLPTLS